MTGRSFIIVCLIAALMLYIAAFMLYINFFVIGSPTNVVDPEQKNSESVTETTPGVSAESAIDMAARQWAREQDAASIVESKRAEYNLNCLPQENTICAKLVVRADKNQKLASALRYAASNKVFVIVQERNWGFNHGAGWVTIDIGQDDAAIIKFLIGNLK